MSGMIAAIMLYAAACGRSNSGQSPTAIQYPEPRYPSYLKPPTSIDEVLPHVRPLVRNKTGFQGGGLGVAQPGETVTFVLGPDAEDLIVAAVTLVLGAGDFSLKLGGFGLGGIGTATFGAIILYALLRRKPTQGPVA